MLVPVEYDDITMEEAEDETRRLTGNFLNLEKNGTYGITSVNGKTLLPVMYDDVELLKYIDQGKHKGAWFVADNGEGYVVVNAVNQIVIPFEYDDIEVVNRTDGEEFYFSVELVEMVTTASGVEKPEFKKGLCTSKGKMIFPAEYDEIRAVTCYNSGKEKVYFMEEMDNQFCGEVLFFVAGKELQHGLFSVTGEEILPLTYSLIMPMRKYEPDNIATDFLFLVGDNQQYGVIASDGRVIVPVKYEEIENDMLDGVIIVHAGEEIYYYRHTGEILLTAPSGGVAPTEEELI